MCYAFCSDPQVPSTAEFYVPYNTLRFHIMARPRDTMSFLGGVGDFRLTGLPRDLQSLNFTTENHDGVLVVSIPALVRSAYEHNWLPDSCVADRFKRIIYHLLR